MPYNYVLKHKDDDCAHIMIDKADSKIYSVTFIEPALCPVPGTSDSAKIKKWWSLRAIPGTGQFVKNMLAHSGCYTAQEYLERNLGLSLTDCYWICPKGSDLKWDDVKLYGKTNSKIPYHSPESYDPNASLSGMMDKYWDISSKDISLVKIAEARYGQQAVNEAFATMVHDLQKTDVPYVKYTNKEGNDGSRLSICPAFTSENIEFITAYDIVQSGKQENDESEYEFFIRRCEELGMNQSAVRKTMDYMALTDFAILNTDEHLMNFGILRDSNSLKYVGMAPIFDSGNSMTFKTSIDYSNIRKSILEMPITSMYKKYESALKCVSDRTVINPDKLPDKNKTYEFYRNNGMPEDVSEKIVLAYEVSAQMLREFCDGKPISLYHEKQRQNNIRKSVSNLSGEYYSSIHTNKDTPDNPPF